jgi:hypothetical protein
MNLSKILSYIFPLFRNLDVLLQQNDNHIERTIDVIFAIDEDNESATVR